MSTWINQIKSLHPQSYKNWVGIYLNDIVTCIKSHYLVKIQKTKIMHFIMSSRNNENY